MQSEINQNKLKSVRQDQEIRSYVLIKQLFVTFPYSRLKTVQLDYTFYFPGILLPYKMGRWPVLHDRPTVASLHRSVRAPRRSIPHDSLDLHLLSCYQHNREIFPQTSDVIRHPAYLQPSTFVTTAEDGSHEEAEQSIVYGGLHQRPSIHSVKLGIGANHIAQTNAGFSRKLDGTFYSL